MIYTDAFTVSIYIRAAPAKWPSAHFARRGVVGGGSIAHYTKLSLYKLFPVVAAFPSFFITSTSVSPFF